MNKKVKIGARGGVITLTDKHYKAAGGEASIYVNGNMAFKLYHDPVKKQLPLQKMRELALISNPHVVIPKEIIFDSSNGDALGYVTDYVDSVEPLLKLFTRTFKQDNKIDQKMIAELVKQMQLVTTDVHGAKCLIVDFNELNVLVDITPNILTPWFIDTDSYSTPSYKATAIMDSVRDRRVSITKNGILHYNPDILSDWFSWGVLSFWLYSNIHPYRSNHPNYKPKDKVKQMDDGVSVFHTGSKCPPSVNDFNTIPKRHLDWFKDTFLHGHRSVPPLADSIAPLVVPTAIITIQGNAKIDVKEVASYPETILSVMEFMGLKYAVGQSHVYCDGKELADCGKNKKTLLVPSTDGTVLAAIQSGTTVTFKELHSGKVDGTISTTNMFSRNGCIYTVTNGKLVENSFSSFGNKTIHNINEIENVAMTTSVVYDGCVIQDLLGKKFLTLPYAKGASFSKYLPALDGYRVIDAKSEKTVTVIVAEKKGQFDRFVIVFNKKNYNDFDVRKDEDIAYDTINFCVMDNGVCLLLSDPDSIQLFVNNSKIETLDNPPFDSTMKLFSTPDGIFFINNNSIHQIKKK